MFSDIINRISLVEQNGKFVMANVDKFLKKDFDELLRMSEREIILELTNSGMINSSKNCPTCNMTLTYINFLNGRHPYFRCSKRSCDRKKISIFKNSIFDAIKIKLTDVLEILYSFSCRRTLADTSETLDISKPTIISFYALFRSSITCFLDKFSNKVGGSGVVIHFDETPITSRHGDIGRNIPSNTVWVVGAVDIYSRKCFLKFLPSRSREDLFRFLTEWVLPGSVVHTDCHRSYLTLSSLGFEHFTVNHSRNLVGPDGIHTNWIEGIFGCLKKLRRKYDANWNNVDNLERFLSEFCFRYSFDCWNRQKAFLMLCFMFKLVREELNSQETLGLVLD